jgi:NhaP-type Na+/H+ and K+/H+ antiporter
MGKIFLIVWYVILSLMIFSAAIAAIYACPWLILVAIPIAGFVAIIKMSRSESTEA